MWKLDLAVVNQGHTDTASFQRQPTPVDQETVPMQHLDEIRDGVRACRNNENPACHRLIEYRVGESAPGASHPVLFQLVPNARVMIIGAWGHVFLGTGQEVLGLLRTAIGRFRELVAGRLLVQPRTIAPAGQGSKRLAGALPTVAGPVGRIL